MKEKQRKLWRKWFRKENLIVLILSGVLLFIIALPTKQTGADKAEKTQAGSRQQEREAAADLPEESGADPVFDANGAYAARQEKRLSGILSSMEGVGRVEVMLTFASSQELVVEKDPQTSRSVTDEEDSGGGKRNVTQSQEAETTVCRTAGGESTPYVVKTISPRVEGVLVVAEGADKGSIKREITRIVQALFGVEAHKVSVVPMG